MGYHHRVQAMATTDNLAVNIKNFATTKEGVWRLIDSESDSLKPFLYHCGVPRLVVPLMASAFNKDKLYIQQNESGEVSVELKRDGWNLPVKLQTAVTYSEDKPQQILLVDTPRGPQQCRLIESSDTRLVIRKMGPSPDEQVDEEYALIDENKLHQILRHRNGETVNTELNRFFQRESDESCNHD